VVAKFKRVAEQGVTFVFKYDPDDEMLLHIYARHLTTPSDALDCFFHGTTTYNSERRRFESTTNTHALLWFWLDENARVVMVITCFTQ
jgi:hypothetical protein